MSGFVQATSNYLQSFKTGFEEKCSRFSNWTSVKFESVKKTTRAFLDCLANIALWPLRQLVTAAKATRDFFFGRVVATNEKKPEESQSAEIAMKKEADVSPT